MKEIWPLSFILDGIGPFINLIPEVLGRYFSFKHIPKAPELAPFARPLAAEAKSGWLVSWG